MKKFGFGGESSVYVFIAAVAIFCIILGFSFGATWRGSVSETAPFGWTEFWLNRYQTGLTILAAIFIAKQQIDAARKQHVAQIKRSFQKELNALSSSKAFVDRLQGYTFTKARIASLLVGTDGAFVPKLHHDEYAQLQNHLPFEISHALKIAMNAGKMLQEKADAGEYSGEVVADILKQADWIANYCIGLIDEEHRRLSQFWS